MSASSSSSSSNDLKQPLLVSSISLTNTSDAVLNDPARGGSRPTVAYDSIGSGATTSSSSSHHNLAIDPTSSPSSSPPALSSSPSSAALVPKQPKPRWMQVADRAVRGFARRKAREHRRKDWNACTLTFPSDQQEKVFLWYFAQLRERGMRGAMLALIFCYIIYSMVEWRSDTNTTLTVTRGVYVVCVLGFFCWSYVRPIKFRQALQEWTMSVALLTSFNILLEAALLNAVYSPFVVMVILLFLLSSSVIVRLRFGYTCIVCWSTLLLYDLICLSKFRTGDSTIDGATTVMRWISYYNFVMVFTIFVTMKISHRIEVAARYEFLNTSIWSERKHREYKKKKQEQRAMESTIVQTPQDSTIDLLENEQESKIMQPTPQHPVSFTSAPLDLHESGLPPSSSLTSSVAPSPGPGGRSAVLSPIIGEDSSDSDWDSEDEESLNPSAALDEIDDGVDSTMARFNAGIQKKLHDLFFVQQTARGRAHSIMAESDDYEISHDAGAVQNRERGRTINRDEEKGAPPGLTSSQSVVDPSMRHRSSRRRSTIVGSSHSHLPYSDSTLSHAAEPADQMTYITKALTESGVSDMAAFLKLLGQKSDQRKSRSAYGYEDDSNLPKYFLAYPYITGYYRSNFSSLMCWQSIFKWHNETLNIWSEFAPAALFFILFWYVMYADQVLLKASDTDRVFVAIGLVGALIVRPICSGLAHTFYCQNERAYYLWWSIDYVSICISILCTCLVFGRFTFACLPEQQSFFYVSLIGLFLSTIISVLFVSSNGVRTGSFLLFVLFAIGVPFFYAISLKLSGSTVNDVPSTYVYKWVGSLCCFVVGLLFKSSGFPECCSGGGCAKAGLFNIFGASHLWWHVCINVGNMMAWFVFRDYLEWRQVNTC